MNASELAKIEESLSVSLPEEFRNRILHFPAEWREVYREEEPNPIEFYGQPLCWDCDEIIRRNVDLRDPEYDMASVFPDWWKQFFPFGTNGAGDFYCVRLDGQPGVWMIGTDCGDKPILVEESFDEFLKSGLNQPIPDVVPQQSANSRLEKAFLGTWRFVKEDKSTEDKVSMYVQVGQIIRIEKPSESYLADLRAKIEAYPLHLESGLWKKWLAEAGQPTADWYQVWEVNDAENWMRISRQDKTGGWVTDYQLQFEPGERLITWITKKRYQRRYRDPFHWELVSKNNIPPS